MVIFVFNSQLQLQHKTPLDRAVRLISKQINVCPGKLAHLSYLAGSQGGSRKKNSLHIFLSMSYTYTHAHMCRLVIRENSPPHTHFFQVYGDMKAFIYFCWYSFRFSVIEWKYWFARNQGVSKHEASGENVDSGKSGQTQILLSLSTPH